MKKIMALLLSLVTVLILFGCEYDLEYYKVELISCPDKLVYIQNVDTELDMSGFVAKEYNRTSEYDLTVEDDDYFLYAEPEDYEVDFSKEGVYYISHGMHDGNLMVSFPVYVISQDKVDEMYYQIHEQGW